jgi:ferredoxin-NADP reductase
MSARPDIFEMGSANTLLENQAEDQKRLELRVRAIKRETADIACFELVDPQGQDLPRFAAGAHINVRLSDEIQRQYSLCNDPAERNRYVIAVLKEPGGRGGSLAMHELAEGRMLVVSAPLNRFPLAGKEARFHLLLAGGIGVTPMMAMVAELEARQCRWHLHYCTKSRACSAFIDQLQPLILDNKVQLHHDGGNPERGLNIGRTLSQFEIGTHVYFCGPPGFMRAVKDAVGAWPPHNVHCEYFTAPIEQASTSNMPFQIKIQKSGQVFDVPADKSIVSILRENNFHIETDCEEGYCGTCITRYLEGEPEHRDTVLSAGEREKYVMICCARSKSPTLVLDP